MANSVKFINPYNFIPMGESKGIADEDEKKRTYTGVIEYSVMTKSPLFIPNTSNDKTFRQSCQPDVEHKSYDFYSYNDLESMGKAKTWEKQCFRPVIPGSEIRGMFRSNFEILTNSCMSALDTDQMLSKRTMARFEAGLLKIKGSFLELYKAKDALWRTKGKNNTMDEGRWNGRDSSFYTRQCYIQERFPEGCHVSFTEEQREDKNGKPIKSLARKVCKYDNNSALIRGRRAGYILKGEKGPEIKPEPGKIIPQKHCCHIFYNPGELKFSNMPLEGNKLDRVLQEYEKNGNNTYKEYREQWEQFKKGGNEGYFPVYFSEVESNGNKIWFLSPACITREIYDHTLADLAGNLKPCEDGNKLCPACRLFGTVMKDSAVASRIRFSDLEFELKKGESEEDCYEAPTTLPPLASPKLNNMEFYLRRPNGAVFWTYDYYIDEKGSKTLHQGELAGRKFYWHNVKNLEKLKRVWDYDGKADQKNITVRPLKEGYIFHGKLYFKKLSQKELDLLIYLINTGDEEEIERKHHGYKLGAAKPLGFGSIACHADKVKLITYQKKEHTIVREDCEYIQQTQSCLVDKEIEKNFEKMTNFGTIPREKEICYPYVNKKSSEGFDWFVKNHVKRDGTGGTLRKREDMGFKEYMQAMEPELKRTHVGKNF